MTVIQYGITGNRGDVMFVTEIASLHIHHVRCESEVIRFNAVKPVLWK